MSEEKHYIFSEAQREEIKALMKETMTEYFDDKGRLTKNVLVTGAVIIGSITVILGGAKALLGWLGFSMIQK